MWVLGVRLSTNQPPPVADCTLSAVNRRLRLSLRESVDLGIEFVYFVLCILECGSCLVD
jgi:hypothetical protein